jgi:signal transduction histidine kinase
MRINLLVKFIAAISVIIILVSLSMSWFFISKQVVQIKKSLQDRSGILARNLANNSEYGVLTLNRTALARLAGGVYKEEDVIYSLIYDQQGQLLISVDKTDGRFREMDPSFLRTMQLLKEIKGPGDISAVKQQLGTQFTFKNKEQVYDTVYPVIGERMTGGREEIGFMEDAPASEYEVVGFVRVGLSLERMNEQIRRLKTGVILLTLDIILVGILLTALMVRIIVRPIQQLVIGTHKIAKGDLDYRVEIRSQDEIGILSQSFNQMAEDLRNYVWELNKEKEHLLYLKTTLEQRTNELEETLVKMRNIQQELLRSEKFATIGRLASSVAHELRNPLASLKNISYYLIRLGAFTDEKAKRMLEMLNTDVGRANKIVTDLLDYSRIKKINRVTIKLREFCSKLLDEMHLGDAITLNHECDDIEVLLDPDRITQVVVNLVNNARDAMPNGGTITVTAHKRDEWLAIQIKDTGSGIAKENLEHIFEPLFTTKTKGLGLGLAIVKEIIDAHLGKISISSEPGKGTTFEILLPLQ